MADNDRGTFKPEVPCTCSPHCEFNHGDQAPDPLELEIDRLKSVCASWETRAKTNGSLANEWATENDRLKRCLFQMQNAAIDLTKQLAATEKIRDELAIAPSGGPSRALLVVTCSKVIEERDQLRTELAALTDSQGTLLEAVRRERVVVAGMVDAFCGREGCDCVLHDAAAAIRERGV